MFTNPIISTREHPLVSGIVKPGEYHTFLPEKIHGEMYEDPMSHEAILRGILRARQSDALHFIPIESETPDSGYYTGYVFGAEDTRADQFSLRLDNPASLSKFDYFLGSIGYAGANTHRRMTRLNK